MKYDWPVKSLNLQDILLDTDNIRLDLSGKVTQELLIADLFANEGAMELVTSIANDGLFPDELPVVVEQGKKYVVIEGNRRIAALKAIRSPDEAPKYFAGKIKQIGVLPDIASLHTVVAPSREDVQKLIASKHTKNLRKRWKPLRQAYFYKTLLDSEEWNIARLQSEFTVQNIPRFIRMLEMHRIAKSLDYRTDEIALKVHDERRFQISTLERIYDSQKAQTLLGFSFDADGTVRITAKPKAFKKAVQRIVQDVAMNNVDSRQLNKDDKIEDYVNSIIETPIYKTTTATTAEDFHEHKVVPKPVVFEKSARKPQGVIPKHVVFRLKSSALRIIFDELREINVQTFPNAAHDLLKSFLECSLVEYLKQIGEYERIQKNHKHIPTLGEMLTALVNENLIKDAQVVQALNEVKSNWSQPYSLGRMNMVNHNEHYASTEKDVRATWAKIEKLMVLILNPKTHG